MRMRVVFIGEYELSESLTARINVYGTADPVECAKVDMETASVDPWLLLELVDAIRVAGIEPVNE